MLNNYESLHYRKAGCQLLALVSPTRSCGQPTKGGTQICVLDAGLIILHR